ncbi:TetR/AcrR family transcriptional regulator [uncultured Maritalea sp.]|jgi:AcrR family transcriptional regulator|uniref:TetR/AcrR family transcriptional regulator n=1 Tax=uncultured Maritalea sp. TaxID=757249 RepID=UPI00261906B0|nr:TetR/AcrR family transcriptional regulator [uncultured Maritalea sp.]
MRHAKSDWLDHGIEVLKTAGATGLKLEAMVGAMRVTRGSFYWHFENIDAFKKELLEHWRIRINQTQIEQLSQLPNSAEQIEELVRRVLAQSQELEAAIRTWAGSDPHVAEIVKDIDKMRVDYLYAAFVQLGVNPDEALARATLMHWAYVGRAVAPYHDEKTLLKMAPVLAAALSK